MSHKLKIALSGPVTTTADALELVRLAGLSAPPPGQKLSTATVDDALAKTGLNVADRLKFKVTLAHRGLW